MRPTWSPTSHRTSPFGRSPLHPVDAIAQGPRGCVGELPNMGGEFERAIAEHQELRSTVNRYGERNIDLVSGFAENVEIPETFVDYSANPREFPYRLFRRSFESILESATYTTIPTTSSKSRCG